MICISKLTHLKVGIFKMGTREDLKARRIELGLTLEDVAKIVGVGKSTVRKWETGFIANMKADKIESYAKALKTTPIFIMGMEEKGRKEDLILTEEEKEIIRMYRNVSTDARKFIFNTIKAQQTPVQQDPKAEAEANRVAEEIDKFLEVHECKSFSAL